MKDNNILMMVDITKATFPWGAELNIPLKGVPENLKDIVNHAIREEKEHYYKKWEKIVRIHNQQWCGEQTVEPYLRIYIPGGKDPNGKFNCSLCVFFTDLKDKVYFYPYIQGDGNNESKKACTPSADGRTKKICRDES